MGQEEILLALKKGDELTSTEIAEKTGCSIQSVIMSIKRLLRDSNSNVILRVMTQEEKQSKYGHKLGCRIHIYRLNK